MVETSGHSLKIGFYMKYAKHSLTSRGNVLGEEIYAETMCRLLKNSGFAGQAELYAPNYLPKSRQDIMIYLSDTPLVPEWADKHILYLQNGYADSKKQLEKLYSFGYDAYMFISDKLLDIHRGRSLKPGLFLPFGVDTSVFYPREHDERLKCDVAYVGNDIKGKERTLKFLYPAINFDFALYGRWSLIYPNEVWKNERYQLKFAQKCRGKIPQEYVPVLYSTASINLNCTIQDLIDWDTITLRSWEVLACKGFLISDGSPHSVKNLSDYIVFTDGGYDLHKKIKYYLAHPEERKAYAERGYKYVLEHETIEARMKELIDFLSAL
ncbi:MAG: glycosyltransferase [Selenomonadaceae bacterium]|nr:glycosyltransferase [Selenomonadaceae bacterium]